MEPAQNRSRYDSGMGRHASSQLQEELRRDPLFSPGLVTLRHRADESAEVCREARPTAQC
jgi:hypothetical protein